MSQENPQVVRGVAAIARVIDEPNLRRANYLLERGYIAGAYKEGRGWALSVPKYRRAVHGEVA